ncbi:DUF4175 family protein [Persicobacter diffluens]|uniref:ATPase n=1 Tax=Persicobacter diffluens TaxID=981 RepID=A0AAN4VUB0_9BACT|nr:hypothetical protein PEDI_00010 [Persicobacter diffluens]
MTNNHRAKIDQKLSGYKKKYYLNQLLKGSIFSFTIVATAFLLFNTFEFTSRFDSTVRAVLFYGFIAILIGNFLYFILNPLLHLLGLRKPISDQEAAQNIGSFLPNIGDRLLNLIQLKGNYSGSNDLIKASIDQKENQLDQYDFQEAVPIKKNKQYLKYLYIPSVIIIAILLFVPQFFTESTKRIVRYDETFAPEALFDFNLKNQKLIAFRNEDFTVDLNISGKTVPAQVYLKTADRKFKLKQTSNTDFQYTFNKIQQNQEFQFEAAGFSSSVYKVKVVPRPKIKNFEVSLEYPAYLGRETDYIANTGNFEVPEGTKVKWSFLAPDTRSMEMHFQNEDTVYALNANKDGFELEKSLHISDRYEIKLENEYGKNNDPVIYQVNVIKDEYPKISLEQFQDTVLFNYIILGGNISDDHGLKYLSLKYRTNSKSSFKTHSLPIDRSKTTQGFYLNWPLDTLQLSSEEKMEYYLQVTDNDQINGPKSTKTGIYTFKVPTKDDLKEKLAEGSANNEKSIDKNIEQAKQVRNELKNIEQKLKSKKSLSWQDKQQIDDLIKKREELNNSLKELQEEHQKEVEKRNRFEEQKNESIKEKVAKLQELMDDLLDEETKKLYEELQQLMEEQAQDMDQIQDKLKEIEQKESNLEEELERTLELFKRMKFDFKADEITKQLQELEDEQSKLNEKTEEASKNELEEIAKEQEKLDQEFKDMEKDLNELQKINNDLKRPNALPDMAQEEQNIQKGQEQFQEAAEQKKKKQAQQSQQQISQNLQKMKQKMEQMQQSMEMQMVQENMNNLRHILNNLIHLSFNQEQVMKDFRKTRQSDPRFVNLSQEQIKIQNDSKIVQDSLKSLAERVFQISSFVTRELNDLNSHLDEASNYIKERKKGNALSEQQFAMTSMNNLALLLDDVLSQMQQQMSEMMGNSSGQQSNQPMPTPSLSQLQQQLNQKINDLKKSGKSGRQLSEEVAKLAQEQEEIRRALEEAEKKANGGGGKELKDAIEKMEETELDLVNKQLTNKMINRQEEIMTRLLESEKADREDRLDDEREGETAKNYDQQVPEAIEEYIRQKQKELERLKTIPLKLNPYYKKEVNQYFKRLENNNIR